MEGVRKNPMYRYLTVLTICSMGGLQAWQTLFNNFAVEVVGLEGNHVGIIQSVREIPGFVALLAIFIMMVIKEHRLSALSILFLGLGVGVTGLFPSYSGLLMTTLTMSFGFQYRSRHLHLPCGDPVELHSDISAHRIPHCGRGPLGASTGSHR